MLAISDAALASPNVDRIVKLRAVLKLARPENSRMVAATIGRHLELIVSHAESRDEIIEVSEAVREASFGFLTSLHRPGDIGGGREAALSCLDQLEASLAHQKDETVPEFLPVEPEAPQVDSHAAASGPFWAVWFRPSAGAAGRAI